MFIDENNQDTSASLNTVMEIDAKDLLAACASEANRQARGMAHLDATLGAALELLRQPASFTKERSALVASLVRDLQQADLLRQELEGLAKTLELLARFQSLTSVVRAEHVRDCTPIGDLQRRLLQRIPAAL